MRDFLDLKSSDPLIGRLLLDSIFGFVRYRQSIKEIMKKFESFEKKVKRDVLTFFSTLKGIALQEDLNYPPPYLGSKYTLAVYVLLSKGFELRDIRRMLKF